MKVNSGSADAAGYAYSELCSLGERNRLFPVFLKAEQLNLLVVGGGKVALEKLHAVLGNAPAADVIVVAPEIGKEVVQLQETFPLLRLQQKVYDASDLEGRDWVIVAAADRGLARQVRADAHRLGLLVNVADDPELCDFYLGSIVQKGHLKVAISTNGKSPTIAKRLKEIFQQVLPDELGSVLLHMETIRGRLSGDFSAKVKKLNAITSELTLNPDSIKILPERKWKRIAYWCIWAFFFMLVGHVALSFIPFNELYRPAVQWLAGLDRSFYLMVLAGFLAQLVDGALGMGYGVTCTSVLLSIGVPLPAISGSIHTAEMFSSGASGLSHYKFGNINKKLFRLLLVPGLLGAVAGALLLSWLGNTYAGYIKPVLAVYTLLLGARILHNAFKKSKVRRKPKRVGWLAAAGGFLDSFGGGGWGPLVTSTLIAKGKTPRYVIGTVSLTEFFVTLASALTFFTMIGISHLMVVLGLIIGGLAGAPFAAKLAGRLPLKAMFIAVGSLVILWSMHILYHALQPLLAGA